MIFMLPIMFVMFTCTGLTHHTPSRYNGYGERWLAPIDETAMSKPAEYSSKGDDVEVSRNQTRMLKTLRMEIQTHKQASMQACTVHPSACFICQGIINDEEGERDWAKGDGGNSKKQKPKQKPKPFNGNNTNKNVGQKQQRTQQS